MGLFLGVLFLTHNELAAVIAVGVVWVPLVVAGVVSASRPPVADEPTNPAHAVQDSAWRANEWAWAEIGTDPSTDSGFRLRLSARQYSSQADAAAALASYLHQRGATDRSYLRGADRLQHIDFTDRWLKDRPHEICAPPRRWLTYNKPATVRLFVVDRHGGVRMIRFPLAPA
ncbi:hypothetical protein ACWIGI_26925 [Nocardia sp. NPDC055321]